MESGVTELQRQHRYVKLKLLWNSPYRSPLIVSGVIRHWIELNNRSNDGEGAVCVCLCVLIEERSEVVEI